jgi:hypothetical protein
MPIRPENRDRYPKDWPAISKHIRERAGNKCEQCGVANGVFAARSKDAYMLSDGRVFDAETGEPRGKVRGSEFPALRWTTIVLTVAHLDHTPENCDDSNLRCLCQRCHLAHDREEHVRARKTNATRTAERDGQQRLPGVSP